MTAREPYDGQGNCAKCFVRVPAKPVATHEGTVVDVIPKSGYWREGKQRFQVVFCSAKCSLEWSHEHGDPIL